jgi:hypothetical protein
MDSLVKRAKRLALEENITYIEAFLQIQQVGGLASLLSPKFTLRTLLRINLMMRVKMRTRRLLMMILSLA